MESSYMTYLHITYKYIYIEQTLYLCYKVVDKMFPPKRRPHNPPAWAIKKMEIHNFL